MSEVTVIYEDPKVYGILKCLAPVMGFTLETKEDGFSGSEDESK